ncbi:MAG: hypothetical protein JO215_02955 [Ktedonobacteraceae bacterium]|nr:hypothetical protein [Ktedonobacteraceae bacterium]MBV9616708.1 hypothetical protein [Ktedonobacteraceae bacterium]
MIPAQQVYLSVPGPLLILLGTLIPIFIFYGGYVLRTHQRRTSRIRSCIGCVPATVTEIALDTNSWRDGWIVIAAWIDARNQHAYTFRSSPQEFPPKKHIGDRVLVFIDSNNPLHYSMEL